MLPTRGNTSCIPAGIALTKANVLKVPICAQCRTAHFLVNFSLTAVHTNKFAGWKAGMTSFSTRLLVKESWSIFSRTHEQIKLVKEKLSRKNCSSVRGLTAVWSDLWMVSAYERCPHVEVRLYEQKRPALAGFPVGITGIPACRDGMKNVPLPCKRIVKSITKVWPRLHETADSHDHDVKFNHIKSDFSSKNYKSMIISTKTAYWKRPRVRDAGKLT